MRSPPEGLAYETIKKAPALWLRWTRTSSAPCCPPGGSDCPQLSVQLRREVSMHHHLSVSPADVPAPPARPTPGPVPGSPPDPRGHAHFWERAFSRRRFVRTAAGTTALVVG